jgi:hypothetical protein
MNILSWIVPLVFFFFIWRILFSRIGPETSVMSFGKSRAKIYAEKEKKITFTDVAGIDEAKEELKEVVEFLKTPGKFQRLGGKIPKGVLLVGMPGTGKTLLAGPWPGKRTFPFSPSAALILWRCLSAWEQRGSGISLPRHKTTLPVSSLLTHWMPSEKLAASIRWADMMNRNKPSINSWPKWMVLTPIRA